MTPAVRARVLVVSLGLVVVLVPVHFFLRRAGRGDWGTAMALLLFFLPPLIAVVRVRAASRAVATEALAYLAFGFGLGLLAGGLGGLGRAILHAVTGEPLPVRLALWIAMAASWALATGAAYGLIMFLVWALRVLVPLGPPPPARTGAGPAATPGAVPAHPLLPGVGPLDRPRRLLVAGVLCGLAGTSAGMAGIILLAEGRGPGAPLLALGAALLLAMLVLRLAAALGRPPGPPASAGGDSMRAARDPSPAGPCQ